MPVVRKLVIVLSVSTFATLDSAAPRRARHPRLDVRRRRQGLTDFSAGFDGAKALAIHADGKVVAVGGTGGNGGRFAVARYDTDGSLDATFGGDGRVRTDFTDHADGATAVRAVPSRSLSSRKPSATSGSAPHPTMAA